MCYVSRNEIKNDVLDKPGSTMMIDIRISTTDGRVPEMLRCSQPEIEHKIILDVLNLDLPKQPPPTVYIHASYELPDTL